MNIKIEKALENLIDVFNEETEGMESQSLTVLISVDDKDNGVEVGINTDNTVFNSGKKSSSIRLIARIIEKIVESQEHVTESESLGDLRKAILAKAISKAVEKSLKKALKKP